MSNCVVRSRGPRLPCSIVADHGIEGSDHLSHDGDDNDFWFLVGRGETVVEDSKDMHPQELYLRVATRLRKLLRVA